MFISSPGASQITLLPPPSQVLSRLQLLVRLICDPTTQVRSLLIQLTSTDLHNVPIVATMLVVFNSREVGLFLSDSLHSTDLSRAAFFVCMLDIGLEGPSAPAESIKVRRIFKVIDWL